MVINVTAVALAALAVAVFMIATAQIPEQDDD